MAKTFGEYFSKEGIYALPDPGGVVRHFKARWPANPYNMNIMECKNNLEIAYSFGGQKWARGILVCAKAKWAEIAKSYGSWVGLAQLHCYDDTVAAGTVPSWASSFDAYGGFLIHEYKPGKIVYTREWDQIYAFFVDSAPPPADPKPPVEDPVEDPIEDPVIPGPEAQGCLTKLIDILKILGG